MFDVLSALMLSTCGAKVSVMTAKQTPRCAPGGGQLIWLAGHFEKAHSAEGSPYTFKASFGKVSLSSKQQHLLR